MKCKGCPFNDGWTEEATKLQDLGCLPTAMQIVSAKDTENKNWLCHNSKKRVCGGLREERDVGTGENIDFEYFFPPIDLLEKAREA